MIEIRRKYGEAMPALADTDAIVGFGNDVTKGSWSSAFDGPIHRFDSSAIEEMATPSGAKDYGAARQHFLYFASNRQMQRDLDLLLEIFPRYSRLHLHVCSLFASEEDFCACYRKELFETPNVHPVGWVSIGSPELSSLAEACARVIHPTCSEASRAR